MKVELFNPVPYYGEGTRDAGWPLPPRLYQHDRGNLSMERGFAQFEAAHEAGFDALNLAEHHYSPAQMTPAPILFAAALGQRLPTARINVFGTDLLLHNPVNIAEQYATLDNLLGGGRLSFALLRGTPNEYLTYGTNPWESRARFHEAVELVIRVFTEPEPFGWEGRFYRFRNIALFPSAVQQPRPRILLSGNSAASAAFAGRMKCDLGLSFMEPAAAAASVATYRKAAADAGWEPTADNILYRQFAYVAESDEQARAGVEQTKWPVGAGSFAPTNPDLAAAMMTAGAAMAGVPKHVKIDPAKAPIPVFSPPWVGAPDTVLAQIRAAEQEIGMGRVELVLHGTGVALDHEETLRSIKLIGQTLLPALHADAPVPA